MYKRIAVTTALLFLIATFAQLRVEAENPHFTTLDFPGAAMSVAHDVNVNEDVVGVYRMRNPTTNLLMAPRGFLLSNGEFSTIHVPGAARTRAYGINDAGDVVGDYFLFGVNYGFLLRAGSDQFQTIRYSDGSFDSPVTDSWDIDEQGNVTGSFDAYVDDVWVGTKSYVWRDGTFTSIMEAPFDDTVITWTHGINASGEIVGCYWLDNESGVTMHSLRVTPEGAYLSEDFPGSTWTMHYRISKSSLIVGMYRDAEGAPHGYLYRKGDYSSIDFPGATATEAHGIADVGRRNPAGNPPGARDLLIVGTYWNADGSQHGYLFTRKAGVVTYPDNPST